MSHGGQYVIGHKMCDAVDTPYNYSKSVGESSTIALDRTRALAANERHLGLADLVEIQHVAAYPLASLGVNPPTPVCSWTPTGNYAARIATS